MVKVPLRVILDTNIWISYLISSKLANIDLLLENGVIRLIFSEESLEEFIDVANQPKFRKFFTPEDIAVLLGLFTYFAEMVEVKSEVVQCRDFKDNFLLALAKDSHADYLITGDMDLLEIGSFESTRILTWSEFEKVVG